MYTYMHAYIHTTIYIYIYIYTGSEAARLPAPAAPMRLALRRSDHSAGHAGSASASSYC